MVGLNRRNITTHLVKVIFRQKKITIIIKLTIQTFKLS